MSRVYDVDWICEYNIFFINFSLRYNMAWYPFDTQSCGMIFQVGAFSSPLCTVKLNLLVQTEGNTGEFVELVVAGLEYTGPKDLTQYFIRHTNMTLGVDKEVEVTVVLGRFFTRTNISLLIFLHQEVARDYPDHLRTNRPTHHHQLLHQFLQAVLLCNHDD